MHGRSGNPAGIGSPGGRGNPGLGDPGLGNTPRSDIGPIGEYLRDITKLPPEVTRPEQYNFRNRIQNGLVVAGFPTPSNRIDPEYVFALRRIKGYISNPLVNQEFAHLFEFNMSDQGRARGTIFDDFINMGVLVNQAHDIVWDSFYAFVPGSDVSVEWVFDAAQLPDVSDVEVGVSITGDLVRVRRLNDGTLAVPGVTPGVPR